MNAKYASKPNFNPNKADLSRQVVPNPFTGEGPADPGQACPRASGEPTTCRLPIFPLCLYAERYTLDADYNNKPNFFTTNYALSISKTRKWRPKS
jgi:hypothetical protein